jgi:hypothetical protein
MSNSGAVDPDDFAERLRNSERARADQAEAAKIAEREQVARDDQIRTHAKTEVRHCEPIARDLVDKINAGSDRFLIMPAGVVLQLSPAVKWRR